MTYKERGVQQINNQKGAHTKVVTEIERGIGQSFIINHEIEIMLCGMHEDLVRFGIEGTEDSVIQLDLSPTK
ncbi:hypothetical protein Lnau_3103 [Legionella nautarum]|uniref:Uncharacterized protein n=2 Tax=Legionella nautarum TaxID=45070 RepID=A0A0W0WIR5_9GAMM|nr:hypothetical protein Lnau_3103 [Legionella nautarum]